jgi:ABC-type nitrate/sulfonate/bicarbonate transport system permease component
VRWRDLGLGALTTLVVWELLSWAIGRPVFPPPHRVLAAFGGAILGDLGRHLLISAWRVTAAIVLAVVTAVPLGIGLGQISALNRLFAPLIYIVHPIPKIVFLPVLLVLLGSGDVSKILLIALILFFQILVVVRDAAAELRPELISSVYSLGAGRRALYRYVYFPAAIPAVLTALRVSVGTAVAVLFIAESFATTSGLGYYIIIEAWGALRYPEMFSGVLAMSLLGLGLYFGIDALDRRLCPWREAR